MRIQVAIVSDQALPNLIPTLMKRPELVLLVVSESMAEKGKHLCNMLTAEGITAELSENAPDVGLNTIYAYAWKLAENLQTRFPDAEISLNATGGTKLMSLGMVEAFRAVAQEVIYTDTGHRRIEIFPPESPNSGAQPMSTPMTDVLDVKKYVTAQGFRYAGAKSDHADWQKVVHRRKGICKYLGTNARDLDGFFGTMNWLASNALDKKGEHVIAPDQTLPKAPAGVGLEALRQLNRMNIIAVESDNRSIHFPDVQRTKFIMGGWLEEYVWHVLHDNGAFDVRLGVEGHWLQGRGSLNEFDVLATKLNQLLYVECKTKHHYSGEDSALAYKTDSLGQDVRGLFGNSWLVTARDPTENLRDRAKQAKVELIGHEGLPHLKKRVLKWLDGEG